MPFRAISAVQTAEMLTLPRPRRAEGKATIVACPMSDEQHALQADLVARYDRLRSQKIALSFPKTRTQVRSCSG